MTLTGRDTVASIDPSLIWEESSNTKFHTM